jgi:hypothetical protein
VSFTRSRDEPILCIAFLANATKFGLPVATNMPSGYFDKLLSENVDFEDLNNSLNIPNLSDAIITAPSSCMAIDIVTIYYLVKYACSLLIYTALICIKQRLGLLNDINNSINVIHVSERGVGYRDCKALISSWSKPDSVLYDEISVMFAIPGANFL